MPGLNVCRPKGKKGFVEIKFSKDGKIPLKFLLLPSNVDFIVVICKDIFYSKQ